MSQKVVGKGWRKVETFNVRGFERSGSNDTKIQYTEILLVICNSLRETAYF